MKKSASEIDRCYTWGNLIVQVCCSVSRFVHFMRRKKSDCRIIVKKKKILIVKCLGQCPGLAWNLLCIRVQGMIYGNNPGGEKLERIATRGFPHFASWMSDTVNSVAFPLFKEPIYWIFLRTKSFKVSVLILNLLIQSMSKRKLQHSTPLCAAW